MSKVYAWAPTSPDEIVTQAATEWKVSKDTPSYESLLQVVAAFRERMLDTTLSYEAGLYTGHPHPWYLDVAFRNTPESAKPFIESALRHHFEDKDETGGTIFPVDQIRFAGDWIFVFGDVDRVGEITKWPWAASIA